MSLRYFEDFEPGQDIDLGLCTVTEDEIVAFARDYDPQPFHVDRDAAAHSIYGGVIASGWHTCGMMMRLVVDGLLGRSSSMEISLAICERRGRVGADPGSASS